MSNMNQTVQMRVARPTDNLPEIVKFYRDGLGLAVLGSFENHAGFSGVMLGRSKEGYHLEFTTNAGQELSPAPTKDNLLVFYLPDPNEWQQSVDRMIAHGYDPVESFNPYWEKRGMTFEDPDGYRVVFEQDTWENNPENSSS